MRASGSVQSKALVAMAVLKSFDVQPVRPSPVLSSTLTEPDSGPSTCLQCGAVNDGGQWHWAPSPAYAKGILCPACRRVAEKRPAGRLVIDGPITQEQLQAICALLRRRADREQRSHPMERLIEIQHEGEKIVVTTTGSALVRGLYVALATSYKGSLQVHYDAQADCLNMQWTKWRDCCRLLRQHGQPTQPHGG
jgi:hypothetical protein